MQNLNINLSGELSYRLYIDLKLFKIAKARETTNFSFNRKVSTNFHETVLPLNDLMSIKLRFVGTAITASLYMFGQKINEFAYETKELVNEFTITIPDAKFNGTTLKKCKVKFTYVD
jgi:hypothetical protein